MVETVVVTVSRPFQSGVSGPRGGGGEATASHVSGGPGSDPPDSTPTRFRGFRQKDPERPKLRVHHSRTETVQ